MAFRGLQIPLILNTSANDLVVDFFRPVLSNAVKYDRGVGFFTSGWIKRNSVGLSQFAENNGHARWVTSPILSKEDWESICLGDQARQDQFLYRLLCEKIGDLKAELEIHELSALAWMIADRIIDFKIAVPRNKLTGEFHDKFGIFTDSSNDKISFSGSYNDSIHGLMNYESITVFKSWEPEYQELVYSEQERFERLWENEDPNVKVYSIPESIRNQLIQNRTEERPYHLKSMDKFISIISKSPIIPANLKIRDYQNDAVSSWMLNNFHGFFEMATGTGKTITALIASLRYFDISNSIALIIACPYKHLVDQWKLEVQKFGYTPILAYESYDTWKDKLANKIIAYNNKDINNICIITTHSTFNTQRFNLLVNKITGPCMLIADEAHHLGTEKSKMYFPTKINARLALSATPNRWFDEEGTHALNDYFGNTIYSFQLNNAIKAGFLTQYFYYPNLIMLTDQETDDYIEITRRIIPMITKKNKTKEDEDRIKFLLIKRANILRNAENKIDALDNIFSSTTNIDHCIVYCSPEQKSLVLKTLSSKHKLKIHQFTYKEDTKLRKDILDLFDQGILQVIVAIKCLDEGVDVPSSRMAFFLANSTNPREFIQRRGRVLRNYPGKDYGFLHDFITIPPERAITEDFELSKSILKRELGRFNEFAQNSVNFHTANDVVWNVAQRFGILDY